MKTALFAIAAATLGLAACADDYYGRGYGPSYGPYGGADLVYYDSFYGPYYNGYWAPDGFFYYSSGRGRPYVRDEGRHFRRDVASGYHGEHMHPGWVGRHERHPG
jgi:hypothetical protein